MTLIQELMNQSLNGASLSEGLIKRFAPAEIREAIQSLVATEQLELANALGDAGLSLYPHDEEILAITSLLAIVNQDWSLAIELMQELVEIQSGNVPAFTYVMYVRALRCNLEPAGAFELVNEGLAKYPGHLELMAEKLSLEDLGSSLLMPLGAQH